MNALVSIDCEVSRPDVRAFLDALSRWQRETKRDMKSAVRSATIDLLRSLRARTRKSRKFIDRMDVMKSAMPPKWIKKGHANAPLRRMQLVRWERGRPRLDHRYVYGGEYARGPKGGLVVRPYSEAHMRREAQRVYGQIRNWGLARKSWSWFMKSLFRKTARDENPKAKIKPGMVDGELVESDGGIAVTLVNRLEYIREAVPPGTFEVAIRKATNVINKKISAGFRSRKFGT